MSLKFLFCLYFLCGIAAGVGENESDSKDTNVELRDDFNKQVWQNSENTTWPIEEQRPLRRRRVRKRKRRPPVYEEPGEELPRRRLRRPQRLDETEEPWKEMEEESYRRPYHRRRIAPQFKEDTTPKFEKIRDPFTALEEAERARLKMKQKEEETDLKSLLKSSGGLSLSEILQQKNLSLSDLLKGKEQAISVLTEKPLGTTEVYDMKFKKTTNRNYDVENDSTESLVSKEHLDEQRKRLALLHNSKDNRIYNEMSKSNDDMEGLTDGMTEEATTTEEVTTIDNSIAEMTKRPSVPRKPRLKILPITNAKLNKLTTVSPKESYPKVPPNAVPISIADLLGINSLKEENKSDEPLKMSISIDDLVKKPQEGKINLIEPTTKSLEKIHPISAKEEILGILQDPSSKERLSRILELRNMTVDELVAQRERGSSQVHLADIFHNSKKEPEPKDEPLIGQINNFSIFDIFQKQATSRPIIDIKPLELKKESKDVLFVTSFPTYKIEINKNLKTENPSFPVWKTSPPSVYDYDNSLNEIKRVDNIENQVAEAVNEQLNIELKQNYEEIDDGESYIKIPSRVKSTIIASFVIVGTSMLVFLTIFIIFKWSQKQRKRLSYNNSFSSSRIKSPILETKPRRSIRTIMNETLGRRTLFARQSMSDYVWDDRKPFQ